MREINLSQGSSTWTWDVMTRGGGGGFSLYPLSSHFSVSSSRSGCGSIYLSVFLLLLSILCTYVLAEKSACSWSTISRLTSPPPPPLWIDGSSLLLGPWFQVVVDTPYVSTTDDDTHPLTRLLTMLFFVFRRSWCMLSFVVVAVVVGCG